MLTIVLGIQTLTATQSKVDELELLSALAEAVSLDSEWNVHREVIDSSVNVVVEICKGASKKSFRAYQSAEGKYVVVGTVKSPRPFKSEIDVRKLRAFRTGCDVSRNHGRWLPFKVSIGHATHRFKSDGSNPLPWVVSFPGAGPGRSWIVTVSYDLRKTEFNPSGR